MVLNRTSRRGGELADTVLHELAAQGIEAIDDRDAANPERRVDCVVVAGGDGTIVHAIAHAIRLDLPLGIVPTGTINELARTLAIPLEVGPACATIARGATRTIDLGRVNGVYYANEASIGISSRLARLQDPLEKRRLGMWSIVSSAFRAFRHARPLHAVVRFDGQAERFKSIQLTVANSHRFGGLFMASDAAIDDGWLDLYSVDISNVVSAFSVARAIIAGRRESVPGLRTYRSTRFDVHTRHRHHISADGEPAGKTPAIFEILPRALRVFVPHDTIAITTHPE